MSQSRLDPGWISDFMIATPFLDSMLSFGNPPGLLRSPGDFPLGEPGGAKLPSY